MCRFFAASDRGGVWITLSRGYRMDHGKAWYEDDGFWETMEYAMFNKQRWAVASGEIDQVLALLDVQAEATIS